MADSAIRSASAAPPAVPWLPLAGAALLAGPMLWRFYTNLWQREPYQFFPLAVAGAVLLASRAWQEDDPGPQPPGPRWLRVAAWVPAAALALGSALLGSPWLGMAGLCWTALAAAWTTGGWPRLRAFLPPVVMVAITLPPPFGLEENLTRWLRAQAVHWSSRILEGAGLPHLRNGNILEIPVRDVMVEEACSGINSALSVAAAAVFHHLWMRRPAWHLAVMLPLSLVFVFAGNTARIAGGSWLLQYTGIDLFRIPFPHEFVGLVVIAVCLGLIVSLDQLLLLIRPLRAEAGPVARRASVGAARPWLPALCLAAVFGLAHHPFRTYGRTLGQGKVVEAALIPEPEAFSLPDKIGAWELREPVAGEKSYVEIEGVRSRVWRFRLGRETVALALDYPFPGLHDVAICYRGGGWETVSRLEVPIRGEKGTGSRHELQRGRDEYAFLMVSTVDVEGRFVENHDMRRTFIDRFGNPMDGATTFRIQAFWNSHSPIAPATAEAIADLFGEAHTRLIAQLRGMGVIPPPAP